MPVLLKYSCRFQYRLSIHPTVSIVLPQQYNTAVLLSLTLSPIFVWQQQKKEEGAIDSADKEILAEAERLDVKAMGPLILSELLFDENIRDQIKKYKRHFLRVSDRTHAQASSPSSRYSRPTENTHTFIDFSCA